MSTNFPHLLLGKDRRRLGGVGKAVAAVNDQQTFDELFGLLFHHERTLVMRAADAVEKITTGKKQYLQPHRLQLLALLDSADHKEVKWHVAQMLIRLELSGTEAEHVWHVLTYWVRNANESKIVRVNALQALFDLAGEDAGFRADLARTVAAIERERIPSLQARLRKLKLI